MMNESHLIHAVCQKDQATEESEHHGTDQATPTITIWIMCKNVMAAATLTTIFTILGSISAGCQTRRYQANEDTANIQKQTEDEHPPDNVRPHFRQVPAKQETSFIHTIHRKRGDANSASDKNKSLTCLPENR